MKKSSNVSAARTVSPALRLVGSIITLHEHPRTTDRSVYFGSVSRNMPTGTARRVRSFWQSIGSSAKLSSQSKLAIRGDSTCAHCLGVEPSPLTPTHVPAELESDL